MMKNLFLIVLAICVVTTNAQAQAAMPVRAVRGGFLASLHARLVALRSRATTGAHASMRFSMRPTTHTPTHSEHSTSAMKMTQPMAPQLLTRKQAAHVFDSAKPVPRHWSTQMPPKPLKDFVLDLSRFTHFDRHALVEPAHVNEWHKRHMPLKRSHGHDENSNFHNKKWNAMPNKWLKGKPRFNTRFGVHHRGARHGGRSQYRHGGIASKMESPHYRHGGIVTNMQTPPNGHGGRVERHPVGHGGRVERHMPGHGGRVERHMPPPMTIDTETVTPLPVGGIVGGKYYLSPVKPVKIAVEPTKTATKCPIRVMCGEVLSKPTMCASSYNALFGETADNQQRGIASIQLQACAHRQFNRLKLVATPQVKQCITFLRTTTWYQCHDDVLKYCRHEIATGDRRGMHRCLEANRKHVSNPCFVALKTNRDLRHNKVEGDSPNHGHTMWHMKFHPAQAAAAGGAFIVCFALFLVLIRLSRKSKMQQARLVQSGMQADPAVYPAHAAVLMAAASTSYVPVRI